MSSFANDDALDWISDFAENPNIEMVLAALKRLSEARQDPSACAEAVAAIEVVAAANGAMSEELHDDPDIGTVLAALPFRSSQELTTAAALALDSVENSSGLSELWEEADYDAWVGAINELRLRLLK